MYQNCIYLYFSLFLWYKMYRCHGVCSKRYHYHCCYCARILTRQNVFSNHVQKCGLVSTGPCVWAPASICATSSVYNLQRVQPPACTTSSVCATSSVQCSTAHRTTTSYPTIITLSNSDDTPASSTPAQTTCMSKPKRTTCTFCNLVVNKKNIKIHIQRRHSSANTDVTANHHLPSQCIACNKRIVAVRRKCSGFGKPIHVQGSNYQVSCELQQCKRASEFSRRSVLMGFHCIHFKSLSYCPISSEPDITLKEEVLSDMVRKTLISDHKENVSCKEAKGKV